SDAIDALIFIRITLPTLSSSTTRPPHGSTPFPYTTLFRSQTSLQWREVRCLAKGASLQATTSQCRTQRCQSGRDCLGWRDFAPRSEEHTSELQSRENLVCRLLLEKNNLMYTQTYHGIITRV